jgi:hypothetical protein
MIGQFSNSKRLKTLLTEQLYFTTNRQSEICKKSDKLISRAE